MEVITTSKYFWCLKCHRVYSYEAWHRKCHCPNKECFGQGADAWEWVKVRDTVHRRLGVNYPKIPVRGHAYELDSL
jgi:hypothetical protein